MVNEQNAWDSFSCDTKKQKKDHIAKYDWKYSFGVQCGGSNQEDEIQTGLVLSARNVSSEGLFLLHVSTAAVQIVTISTFTPSNAEMGFLYCF